MTDLPSPTPRELEILAVLWAHGPQPVAGVHRLLQTADGKRPAPNTVQTLLRIMETKGLVGHRADGRSFVYEAKFTRAESVARFVDRVFGGAASQLVSALIAAERIPPAELDQMREMIDAARRRAADGG